jgi:isoquinoline 1-oxidoreductase beta subunit
MANADIDNTVLDRRALLKGGLAAGALLAFHLPLGAGRAAAATAPATVFAPNAFIRIGGDGATTLVMPQVEMGQGIYTAIAMILAEELDADFARVAVQHAPPDDRLYGNPVFGLQSTGNSNSVRAFWKPLRQAGAAARAMLVQAAAAQWQVDPASCTTDRSEVLHAASGRRLSYGALVAAAAALPVPQTVTLKQPDAFRLIGQPLTRLDGAAKVNGTARYGIDARLPGLRYATLAQSPVPGGKVVRVDDVAARKLPGVRQVVVLDDLVAVVGDNMWAARSGLDALAITWDDGPHADNDSAAIWRQLREESAKGGVIAAARGDVAAALARGERHEASFEVPLLAHATMEPLNCTVHVTATGCEVWVGTQIMTRVQSEAAKAAGLPVDKVTVHQHLLGGGFGRRLEPDMVIAAVRIGKQVDGPVKVVWTREEDIQHDVYRPVYRDDIAASLVDGRIAAFKYRIAGAAIVARWLPPGFRNGIDGDAVDSASDMPYDIPDFQVEFVRVEPRGVPTGFFRGVGPNNNVFAIESFMDDLARKAGRDPVAFRRAMLGKAPRLRHVLDLAAEKSGWGGALPPRVGRGISLQPTFDSAIATVVEAEVDPAGEIRLRRVTLAVDAGIAVNPDTIAAQLEGGLVFGLTAALYGEITIDKGRVQQSNFHDYQMLRINEMPAIEVHIVRSGEAPGGIGEAGVIGSAPALRNAILAATGVGLNRLPIDRSLLAAKPR